MKNRKKIICFLLPAFCFLGLTVSCARPTKVESGNDIDKITGTLVITVPGDALTFYKVFINGSETRGVRSQELARSVCRIDLKPGSYDVKIIFYRLVALLLPVASGEYEQKIEMGAGQMISLAID